MKVKIFLRGGMSFICLETLSSGVVRQITVFVDVFYLVFINRPLSLSMANQSHKSLPLTVCHAIGNIYQ